MKEKSLLQICNCSGKISPWNWLKRISGLFKFLLIGLTEEIWLFGRPNIRFSGKLKQPELYKLGCYSCYCTFPSTDSKCIYDSNTKSLRLTCLSQAGFILWSQHNAFMAETERFLMSFILYWDPKRTLGKGLHRSMALILCQNATVLTKVNEQWKWQEVLSCIVNNWVWCVTSGKHKKTNYIAAVCLFAISEKHVVVWMCGMHSF